MSLSRKSPLSHPSFRHFSFAICSETDRWKSSLRLGIHPQSILIYHHCFQSVLLIVSHCETLFIHHLRYSIKLLFFLAYSCCLGSGPNSRQQRWMIMYKNIQPARHPVCTQRWKLMVGSLGRCGAQKLKNQGIFYIFYLFLFILYVEISIHLLDQ